MAAIAGTYTSADMAGGGAGCATCPGPESETSTGKDLGRRQAMAYGEQVSRPTMTVYSPKGKNTGAAVVVFPGGGYQVLAIDLEGTEICDWLTSEGSRACC